MKHLINYCPIPLYEKRLQEYAGGMEAYLKDLQVQGIELYVYDSTIYEPDYAPYVEGVHLRFWPCWLDFWLGQEQALAESFTKEQALAYMGAANRDEWLELIKGNLQAAAQLKPQYCTWHVSHCSIPEASTFKYAYNNRQVLEATAEIFNRVEQVLPGNITVLFENLWWPGLTLTEPEEVEYFFSLIKRKNVGIMLDTGHLMNTKPDLSSEEEAIDYVCKIIEALGEKKSLIKGLHLSCSLSGAYRREFLARGQILREGAEIYSHITKLDQHRIFTSPRVRRIIEAAEPEYVVHELFYSDMDNLQRLLPQQLVLVQG